MLGNHCIKTWSASQGAVALSSAQAEFYAMIEGAARAKGLVSLAKYLQIWRTSATDRSAAKSFVCRRELGKMHHLKIRDLWLQKEVQEGRLVVSKVKGEDNPADLMTKILGCRHIRSWLGGMKLAATF